MKLLVPYDIPSQYVIYITIEQFGMWRRMAIAFVTYEPVMVAWLPDQRQRNGGKFLHMCQCRFFCVLTYTSACLVGTGVCFCCE